MRDGLSGTLGRLRQNLAIRRLLRGCRAKTIGATSDGLVRVRGRVRGEPRESPLDGRPVLAWRVAVRHHNPPGTPLVLAVGECGALQLEDGTGLALVSSRVDRLLSLYPARAQAPRYFPGPLPDEIRQLAHRHDVHLTGQGTYSWRLWLILPGQELTVLGRGRRVPRADGHGAGFRQVPTALELGPGPGGLLLITDARDPRLRGRLWEGDDLWRAPGRR